MSAPVQEGDIARKLPHRTDREFLPADLEILETPPSPVRMAMLVAICALVVVALAWSWFGRIDIIATASGKILPTGDIKIVQPLETGKVSAISVRDGSHVVAGETLVMLDPTEAESERAAAATILASYRAELIRRRVEDELAKRFIQAETPIADADDNSLSQVLEAADLAFSQSTLPAEIAEREKRALLNDIRQLRAQLIDLMAQRGQMQAAAKRLAGTIEAEQRLIGTMQTRVDMYSELQSHDAAPKAQLLDVLQMLQAEQARLSALTGQLGEAEAGLLVLDSQVTKAVDTFANENMQKLITASRHVDELEQTLIKADARLSHMTLKSPISGTIQSLAVTTIGQVVSSGQELMRIIPDDSTLEVRAYLRNSDKGFVHEGQEAVIKVEAFPFTRYGTISGEVVRIARDSIPLSEATLIEGDPTQRLSRSSFLSDTKQTNNLVYAVTIRLNETTIPTDGYDAPLSPGMTTVVDIMTGERRILEYLFSPIVEVASSAMKER